jgi:hypothetical protein
MPTFSLKQQDKSNAQLATSSRVASVAGNRTPHLQRKMGNQAVMRLLESRDSSATAPITLQRKLMVNEPGDVHEHEADRVSEQVMRMPEPTVQRACECDGGSGCAKCQGDGKQSDRKQSQASVQPKRIGSTGSERVAAPSSVHQTLTSPGLPLDAATRAFMEPRFGQDFSHVRVHSDAAAEQSAHDVNAAAYTVGNNIVFGSASFAPQTTAGRQLIAHELAHVVQQAGASEVAIQRQPQQTPPKDPPKTAPPKDPPKDAPKAKPQDFAVLLDPSDDFVTHAKAVAPTATILHATTVEDLTKQLKAIQGPIGTLYFVAHMTPDGDILFTSPGKDHFVQAEEIASKIKDTVQVESVDFRGCEVAQAPAEMDKIRTALKATTIVGSTCSVVTQVSPPIKAFGKEITKREQLKDAKVKGQFDIGMKETRKLFTEGKDKCIINDSEDGYFQTGGKLIAVWANPGSMADRTAWDKSKSICHKDLKVEKVDPSTKLPVVGEDDCKLLEIGKKKP